MSNETPPRNLQTLLERATFISENINTAIDSNDDKSVDDLSTQFEEIVSSILSFPIKSVSDLKEKFQFGKKLLVPGHNDPELVNNLFTVLIQDIESIGDIYNLSSSGTS